MTAVRVQVTQQDIDKDRHTSATCPCATAARRAIPGARIRFGATMWWPGPDTGGFDAPEKVSRWISDYDLGLPVAPFEFDLDVPDDLLAGTS